MKLTETSMKTESRLEDATERPEWDKTELQYFKNKFDIDNSRLQGLTNLYDSKLKEIKRMKGSLNKGQSLKQKKSLKMQNKHWKTIKEIREDKHSRKIKQI